MVATFLQAEIDSSRWGDRVRQLLARRELSEDIIRSPRLMSSLQNQQRAELLGDFRGWKRKSMLFQDWPTILNWSIVAIGKNDLDTIRYASSAEWSELSRGTLEVRVGVNRVKGGDPSIPGRVPVPEIREIEKVFRRGGSIPRLIGIAPSVGSMIVMVEGRARITGYFLSGAKQEIELILGMAPVADVAGWKWFK